MAVQKNYFKYVWELRKIINSSTNLPLKTQHKCSSSLYLLTSMWFFLSDIAFIYIFLGFSALCFQLQWLETTTFVISWRTQQIFPPSSLASCVLPSSVVGVVVSSLFLLGIFSLLSSYTALREQLRGVLPPIHSSRWQRERQVHTNLSPAHLIVPELIIKPASEPDLTRIVLRVRGKIQRGRLSYITSLWSATLPSGEK